MAVGGISGAGGYYGGYQVRGSKAWKKVISSGVRDV